jgi:hypothetical protein
MPGLSQNLAGKPSRAEKAARQRRIDHRTARKAFQKLWLEQLEQQRTHARQTGEFYGVTGAGFTIDAGPLGFTLTHSYQGKLIEVHHQAEWNRKTAKVDLRTWTTP